MIKSKMMGWAGHVVKMRRGMLIGYLLVGKPERYH
jgi:hypothetical protein